MTTFDYQQAFSRNIGWLTADEQARLRGARIAIAGMGGVGGSHLLTLTRLGVGRFVLADFDRFELPNFNRQAGASLPHLGQPKVEVLARLARDINPELDIRLFPAGIDESNLRDFLTDVDLYVDGLDFFAVDARRAVFRLCHELLIPATTAAPLGMGAAVLNFLPGGMSFEDYFRLDGHSENEQLLRFLIGLSPAMLQRPYLAVPEAVNLAAHRGPSTAMACELCAGLAATQALKILLGRGDIVRAPWGLHFDAYRNRLKKTWRPGGNHNPIQRVAMAIARRQLKRMATAADATPKTPDTEDPVRYTIERARWAPSGDNTQPWRFERLGPERFVVHGFDTRTHCVYDRHGHPSHIALGALLENIRLAASVIGRRAAITRQRDDARTDPVFDVELVPDPALAPDPLAASIEKRVTQRRPLRRTALQSEHRAALETAVGPGYRVGWLETGAERRWMARLLFDNAGIRLRIREAFEVHRTIFDWNADTSDERIPDRAAGLDPLSTRLMRWSLADWRHTQWLNRIPGATILPRLQLDVLPALGCAAHFVLIAPIAPQTADDYLEAGRAVQRFWLTATTLGLQLQPEMTPLIFGDYVASAERFTEDERALAMARSLHARLTARLGDEARRAAVFMGRIGYGKAPSARSTRLPLARLLVAASTPHEEAVPARRQA